MNSNTPSHEPAQNEPAQNEPAQNEPPLEPTQNTPQSKPKSREFTISLVGLQPWVIESDDPEPWEIEPYFES